MCSFDKFITQMDLTKRKDRTLAVTVEAMLQSPRLRIACENLQNDSMLLRAMLIEFGLECLNVAKSTVIKRYNMHSSMAQFELLPLLRATSDYTTFNLWFNMSPEEQALYTLDPKFQLSKEKRLELQKKVRERFMGTSE